MSNLQTMSDITIEAIAKAELEKHGLYSKGWRHELIDEGTKSRMGYCSTRKKLIVSNHHYIKFGLCAKQIVDTIRHEIAHALLPNSQYSRSGRRMVHGTAWRRMAMHTGATPRATGKMDGYVAPHDPTAKLAKWTMVFINGTEIEEIRQVKKFLVRMNGRYMPKRPETAKNLWLVDTRMWKKYLAGSMKLWYLEFWQDNPNCSVWGSDATAKKFPRPDLQPKVEAVKGELEKCKNDPAYFAANYLSTRERREFITMYPHHKAAIRSMMVSKLGEST